MGRCRGSSRAEEAIRTKRVDIMEIRLERDQCLWCGGENAFDRRHIKCYNRHIDPGGPKSIAATRLAKRV